METKILLRLIKDDIKILEEINNGLISREEITSQEIDVALARARALVMEFEMLSRNFSQVEKETTEVIKSDSLVTGINIKKGFIEVGETEELSRKFKPSSIQEKVEIAEIPDEVKETAVKAEAETEVLVSEETGTKNSVETEIKITEPQEEKLLLSDQVLQEKTERPFEARPLKNIRDGIGLNDHYLFIKELFNNDAEKYENSLTALDGFSGIEEAVSFLKQNFKWNKTETGQKFLVLIKRRFMK